MRSLAATYHALAALILAGHCAFLLAAPGSYTGEVELPVASEGGVVSLLGAVLLVVAMLLGGSKFGAKGLVVLAALLIVAGLLRQTFA